MTDKKTTEDKRSWQRRDGGGAVSEPSGSRTHDITITHWECLLFLVMSPPANQGPAFWCCSRRCQPVKRLAQRAKGVLYTPHEQLCPCPSHLPTGFADLDLCDGLLGLRYVTRTHLELVICFTRLWILLMLFIYSLAYYKPRPYNWTSVCKQLFKGHLFV